MRTLCGFLYSLRASQHNYPQTRQHLSEIRIIFPGWQQEVQIGLGKDKARLIGSHWAEPSGMVRIANVNAHLGPNGLLPFNQLLFVQQIQTEFTVQIDKYGIVRVGIVFVHESPASSGGW
ncbi:hypothetical protein TNIN_379391 [Trichonephila inaurata madagascariensis]|uniref:Uncharacterized protein n=1 Tax=Trichonephila inaurata madagascariensis TaxID=2747483 RepID=A0A8X6YRC5_9ARAC|nr:hypothetical protein TNIN_379391 [Trichonephila inaurata madagascariensis]